MLASVPVPNPPSSNRPGRQHPDNRAERGGRPEARRKPAVKDWARKAALDALTRVETGLGSPQALSAALKDGAVSDPRDRALATELVYGVLRWQRLLDYRIAPHVRRGLDGLEPEVLNILRIGAFQLQTLDRIPPAIAVSATVDLARAVGLGRVSGLINGVLRRVVEGSWALPEGSGDQWIGLRTSLPNWVVGVLRDAFGDEGLEDEALALRARAITTVRPTLSRGGFEALTASLNAEGFEATEGPHGTCVIRGPGDPFATKAFHRGLFTPQDPASLAVIDAMGDVRGLRVLDLCAGRGVKATALADRGALVTAVDIDSDKLEEAERLAKRLGVEGRVTVHAHDASTALLDLGTFDRVLVDAPCSGLGTLRHHPEIAWRRIPEDLPRLALLQSRLLATGARHTADGGTLWYAVCTFARIEGQPSVPSGWQVLESATRRASLPSDGVDSFQMSAYVRSDE